MRWGRRVEHEVEREAAAPEWHEGVHWVAGAEVVVNAERASDIVAHTTDQAA
jgi:hypothetical protein